MGRTSSTLSSFLVARPDSGQYVYQRKLRKRWIDLFAPKNKAQDDNRLYLSAFIAIYGDLPVDKVTRKMVRDFRDLLVQQPRNTPKAIAKLPLQAPLSGNATTGLGSQ